MTPHGVPLDLWHLGLFPAAIFFPAVLAWLAGPWIVRHGLRPPIGWMTVTLTVTVLTAVFAGPLAAFLIADILALLITAGWLGVRHERRIARIEAALPAPRRHT
jgi:hypothetical protein